MIQAFQKKLRKVGPTAKAKDIDLLSKEASEHGHIWELGMALLEVWDFELGNPVSNDRVLRLLVRAGLRSNAVEAISNKSFPGQRGCLIRIKQLIPIDTDTGGHP